MSRVSQQTGSLQVIIEEMAHLPKEKDFSLAVNSIQSAFKSGGADERLIIPQTRKLMSMSHNLLTDRKVLGPLLQNVRNALWEWDEWLAGSANEDGATEEELQECLKRLSNALSHLRESWEEYEGEVLKKLKREALAK